MSEYHIIQRYKEDGRICCLLKRRLDKSKDEVVEMIKKQNESDDYNVSYELIEDKKMIELFYYAKNMETNSDLDDVLEQLRDIESIIERFIDSKK